MESSIDSILYLEIVDDTERSGHSEVEQRCIKTTRLNREPRCEMADPVGCMTWLHHAVQCIKFDISPSNTTRCPESLLFLDFRNHRVQVRHDISLQKCGRRSVGTLGWHSSSTDHSSVMLKVYRSPRRPTRVRRSSNHDLNQ